MESSSNPSCVLGSNDYPTPQPCSCCVIFWVENTAIRNTDSHRTYRGKRKNRGSKHWPHLCVLTWKIDKLIQYLQQTLGLSDIYEFSIILCVNVTERTFFRSLSSGFGGYMWIVCIWYRRRFAETCISSIYSFIIKTVFLRRSKEFSWDKALFTEPFGIMPS